MRAISSGRIPERKDVTEEIERWKKESAEKKLKMQQEWAKKRQEVESAQTSVAS
jgi:hypothetical protein